MSDRPPAGDYIERIVRLEIEKAEVACQIREILNAAKEAGYLKGAIRIVVKRHMEDAAARASREAIEDEADQIMAALGMLADTPLGYASIECIRRNRKPEAA